MVWILGQGKLQFTGCDRDRLGLGKHHYLSCSGVICQLSFANPVSIAAAGPSLGLPGHRCRNTQCCTIRGTRIERA